jgi:hypothetical protein
LDKKLEKSEKMQDKQSEFHESSKKTPFLSNSWFLSEGKWILGVVWTVFVIVF